MAEKTTSTAPRPYTYECQLCGHRVSADRQPMECPKCRGEMQNLSTPRE